MAAPMEPRDPALPAAAPLQERERVAGRALLAVATGAAVVIVLAVAVSTRLLAADTPTVAPNLLRAPRDLRQSSLDAAHAPRVIGVVEQSLLARPGSGVVKNGADERALQRYAWVDREHGVARIPIDRAIDLYVALRATPPDAGPRHE